MQEKEARQLVTKLVNAAYEAGMHTTNPDRLFVKFWKEKADMNDNEMYDLIEELGFWYTGNDVLDIRDFMAIKEYNEDEIKEAIIAFYEA